MNSTRRGCLALVGAGVVGQSALIRKAQANTTVSVSGRIESAIDASVDGSLVEFVSPEARVFENAVIEGNTFEIDLEANATYHITFWHETEFGSYKTEFDGVPLHYDLEQDFQIDEEDVNLGTYEIPEGHETQVRFEDMNGNVIQGLHIGFRTSEGSGTGPQNFFTNAEGYVYSDDENEPGVELVGDISVEVQSPTDHTDNIIPQRISVTEDQEFTIQLQDPERWGGTIIDSESGETTASEAEDGEATSTSEQEYAEETDDTSSQETTAETDDEASVTAENHRGFLTNDPNSSIAFLDDPVTLTWGGILISIVGITMQLLGGE